MASGPPHNPGSYFKLIWVAALPPACHGTWQSHSLGWRRAIFGAGALSSMESPGIEGVEAGVAA